MSTRDKVRFYFSFRSPYSWLALVRVEDGLAGLPVELEYLPVFPPPDFPNDPTAVPNKLAYINHDVARIAAAYGLPPFRPSDKIDCDWVRPHAAFLHAHDQRKGAAFARALFEARFTAARDVGEDATIADAAARVELEPQAAVAAAGDQAYQTRVFQGMVRGVQEDGIFGVPYFVYRDERFWGNDRIEWLIRSIRKAHGMPVVDLTRDRMQPLDR